MMMMSMSGSAGSAALPAAQLARARLATAKYANSLGAAKADGYSILTQLIPGMGYHFINPSIKGFDVRKPPILVYEKHGGKWQLGALEWVFPEKPATPPLKGATYGSFPAACHYKDGTFVPEPSTEACPTDEPAVGRVVQFLAPGARHDARLDLVPEPGRPVREHGPPGARVRLRTGVRLQFRPPGARRVNGAPPHARCTFADRA